jgi:hypothetical protein
MNEYSEKSRLGTEMWIINSAEGLEMVGQEKLQKEGHFSCLKCLCLLLNFLDEKQFIHDQQ